MPEGWGICSACELMIAQAEIDKAPYERGLDEFPPEWQADFQKFSKVILDLSLRYGDSIMIRIFDPRSLQGLIKAIRYRIHRYPTFVIDKGIKVIGLDAMKLEQVLFNASAVEQKVKP